MANDEEIDVECPRCGKQVSTSDEECSGCGFDIDRWLTDEKMEVLLSQVDDETFELKTDDPDSIIERIKQFAPKKPKKEVFTYECPLCGTEVYKDDEKCPGCGALFET